MPQPPGDRRPHRRRQTALTSLAVLGLAGPALALPPEPVVRYDFNETGDLPGSNGSERRPLKMRDDAGTKVDLHSADGEGVSGLEGDRAFDNSAASDHGSSASGATNGFRADQTDNPAIDALGSFTLSGWFRTDTADSLSGKTPRIVNNHDGESGSAGDGVNLQFFSGSDGDLKLEVDDDTGGGVNTTGTPYAAKQTWVFFAVSYDGSSSIDNVNFYVGFRNDTEAGGGVGSALVSLAGTESLDRGPVDDESAGLHVGNRPQDDRPFDGLLDEIRIDDSVLDLATLEEVRAAALVAPPTERLAFVDVTTVATSVQDQNSATVTVDELSGVSYDPDLDVFWAVGDSGGRLLEIDVDFDCDGSILSATALSAVSLVDDLDFEGVAFTDAVSDSVFLCDEGNDAVSEYSLADGSLLQGVTIPAVFSNSRSNRSFEALARDSSDGMLAGVEQALTVDGPDGNSTSVPTVSRWQRFDAALAVDGQVAYELEPVHDTPVGGTGSGLSDFAFMPDDTLYSLERSEGAGDFLTRIFVVDTSGATDVSQGSLGAGLIGESYDPAQKRLLLSDDRFGKLEGLAAKTLDCGGNPVDVLLGVEDATGSNVLRSFVRLPEPGVSSGLPAALLALLVLHRARRGK